MMKTSILPKVPLLLFVAAPVACSSSDEAPAGDTPLAEEVAFRSVNGDTMRGGRLYDRFYGESPGAFSPDDDATPGVADGEGGPYGNGTLVDGDGFLVTNDLGHDFRVKNFFGWDLRGAEGVYGPTYQDKDYVLPYNLIHDSMDRLDVAELFVNGSSGAPAFGAAMSERDLADLVEFVMAVREHRLPQPSDIWALDESAPNAYVLHSGANVAAGHEAISASCSNSDCHGSDGTEILFDDGEYSLGTLSRAKGYEAWLKIVVGHPDSSMGSQLPSDQFWKGQSQLVLDVLAALCDTTRYPAGAATESDVAAGDPRCGTYLR